MAVYNDKSISKLCLHKGIQYKNLSFFGNMAFLTLFTPNAPLMVQIGLLLTFLCPRQIVWKLILEQTFGVSEWHNWINCRCYRCTYSRSRFHKVFYDAWLLFGSKVHKKCKWLFSKHEAVFYSIFFFRQYSPLFNGSIQWLV